jgi:formyl-CoA transferase
MPGHPFTMHDSPVEWRCPAPLLGEHSAEILGELGYDRAETDELVARGVVGVQ